MGKFIYAVAGQSEAEEINQQEPEAIILAVPILEKNFLYVEKLKNFLRKVGVRLFILDSGGFQLFLAEEKARKEGLTIHDILRYNPNGPIYDRAKDTINLTVNHVIGYALQAEPQIVIGLDFPVKKSSDKNEQFTEFHSKLGYNLEWAEQMVEQYKKADLKSNLYLPVQAYTPKQLDSYYTRIKDLKPDGIAIPTRNMKADGLTDFLIYFCQSKVTKLHLLGTASFEHIAIAAYMARHHFEFITFDAQTSSKSAQNGSYLDPWNLKMLYVADPDRIETDSSPDCTCPWCKYEKSYKEIAAKEYKEKSLFLTLHNSWVIKELARLAYDNAEDDSEYRNFLRKRTIDRKLLDRIFRALLKINRNLGK